MVSKSRAVKNALKIHMRTQNCMTLFNETFAPFLLIFVVQIFIQCCALFFAIAKLPLFTYADISVFLGNGTQYLMRAFVALLILGKVGGFFSQ